MVVGAEGVPEDQEEVGRSRLSRATTKEMQIRWERTKRVKRMEVGNGQRFTGKATLAAATGGELQGKTFSGRTAFAAEMATEVGLDVRTAIIERDERDSSVAS